MKKITSLVIILLAFWTSEGFAQFAGDGSYFWNSTTITYSFNDKTELYFGNKDHYSNQINRFDYMHFELIGYRKLSKTFSLGLGIRQTENYKSDQWNPGQSYVFYGVLLLNPWDIKIKFANRLVAKTYKTSDTQYGLDNISNVDFFAKSTNKIPKPYLMDEIFSNIALAKVQAIRLYGGLRLLKYEHWSLDIYYCYVKTRSTAEWKDYNVFGLNTKFRI
jgi:hypothetical protein